MAIVKHAHHHAAMQPWAPPTIMQPCRCLATVRTTTPPIGGAPPPWRRRPLWWCTPVTNGDIRVIVVLATGLANMVGNTGPDRQC
jgi:hypothetical protein